MAHTVAIPMEHKLQPKDMVVMMGGGYSVPVKYQGQVWVVESEPHLNDDGVEVVALGGYDGGEYPTDGLVPIRFPERDA